MADHLQGNDETLVAGTVDGIVSVKRRDIEKNSKTEEKKIKNKISYRYAGDKLNVDAVIKHEGRDQLSQHDFLLRKFQYGRVLDRILSPYFANKAPQVSVAVMQELMR